MITYANHYRKGLGVILEAIYFRELERINEKVIYEENNQERIRQDYN